MIPWGRRGGRGGGGRETTKHLLCSYFVRLPTKVSPSSSLPRAHMVSDWRQEMDMLEDP